MVEDGSKAVDRISQAPADVAARAAFALFGSPPAQAFLGVFGGDAGEPAHNPDWRIGDEVQQARFRRESRRLALNNAQRSSIDTVLGELQPLIIELRIELRDKELRLMALRPDAIDYTTESACLSSDIGLLASQIGLMTSKLKADIHALLTPSQRALLDEVKSALDHNEACKTRRASQVVGNSGSG